MRVQKIKYAELKQSNFDVFYEYYVQNAHRLPFYFRHLQDILGLLDERGVDCGVAIVSSHKNKLASVVPYHKDGGNGIVPLVDMFDCGTPCSEHYEVCDFILKRLSRHPSLFISRSRCFKKDVDFQLHADMSCVTTQSVFGSVFGKEKLFNLKELNGEVGAKLEESYHLCDVHFDFSVNEPGSVLFTDYDSKASFYKRDYLDFKSIQHLWNGCLLGDKSRLFMLKDTLGRVFLSMFVTLGDGSLVELASCIPYKNKVTINYLVIRILHNSLSSGVKNVYFNRKGIGEFVDLRLLPDVNISLKKGTSFV